MPVRVVDYDPKWPEMFDAEAAVLREIIGDNLIAIFHIGSTSVPGLKAKPIIDMLPVVRDAAALDALGDKFAEAGYEAMGEFGIPGRRYFRKGGEKRTHQAHAFQYDDVYSILRHVAFRDYMREHAGARAAYGALKAELAARFPNDLGSYCDGKDEFVKEYEKRALIWRWRRLAAHAAIDLESARSYRISQNLCGR
ncbi:hypothetical protein B5F39_01945 [Cloacibacillus sp. An23]|nr:hypothetical protein B5F39_01945 [Cloacibacillus sp. An23]